MQLIERHTESLDWLTLLFVGCIVVYGLTKYLFPRRFQEFIALPLSNKYFLVQGRNEEIQHPFNMLLFVTQIISFSVFIYLVTKTAIPDEIATNKWIFVQIISGYTFFILTKYFVEKIIGTVFSMDSLINRYLYQKLSYRNLIAILVLVANLFFVYVFAPSLTLLLIFAVLLLVLNCIALFYSYKTNGKLILGNFFYFILYLCALEISPYIIIYKALT
ncbi:DUF4271 domain-containing protein [Jejudonia soesokkakensis]|uniref:DUF4271 domain-containing protein n=1 Tax=Jejudonia soesokkakensis TaxID=1323432 RepID=A0ABW2MRT8_9FLAO